MRRALLTVTGIGLCLLVSISLPALQDQSQSQPQAAACGPEESVVVAIAADLAATVKTVKQESLDDFEKQFHQQACMSKLSICLSSVDGLLDCLNKTTHDAGTTKQEADTRKAKRDTYTKLKSELQQDMTQLKAAKNPKAAKAEIEQFDFTH